MHATPSSRVATVRSRHTVFVYGAIEANGLRPAARAAALLLALLCLSTGAWLAWNYPIAQPAAPIGFALLTALFAWYPSGWLMVMPALLPVIGFAPYSGWITFEECDVLVLAAAAGGYARLALQRVPAAAAIAGPSPRRGTGNAERGTVSVFVWLLLLAFGASVLIAMWRGFADSGGFLFGWFQGYHESMNSVRIGKSFFLAALLLPLWLATERDDPQRASRYLLAGMTAGLAAASLATVWERLAFTGLLNFSTDYRTTALFWEMHVGGVALESFLAATIPFALAAMFAARTWIGYSVAAAAGALAGYAATTSFSRGVYLAVPVGIAIMLALNLLRQRRLNHSVPAAQRGGAWPALLLLTGFVAAAAWMFPTSGYRGLLALMGVVTVWLGSAESLARMTARQWYAGIALGCALSALGWAASYWVPKGAYVVFGLDVVAALALVALQYWRSTERSLLRNAAWLLAFLLASATAMALVALHWGGPAALQRTVPALVALALLTSLSCSSAQPLVPASLRWQGAMVGAMVFATLVVGVFNGGAYMTGRMSAGGRDMEERIAHWERALDMLATPSDWVLGKGPGRFPASFYLASTAEASSGDYRIIHQGTNSFLRLSAGSQQASWGTLLRMTQRIAAPGGPPLVQLDVRTDKGAQLHFEVCEKHLIYSSTCLAKSVWVEPSAGKWHAVQVRAEGALPTRGAWFAPALISFSLSLENSGELADVDNVALIDADGRDLLINGDFSQEMARWFFSSDLNHRPWHIQNMWVNLLFEQGALGLLLFMLLSIVAFWRVSIGRGRDHALAPATGGALAGIAAIGLFDTLLDAPRVAMLCYFVLMLALVIRSRRPGTPAA